jgi:hypothetical protein
MLAACDQVQQEREIYLATEIQDATTPLAFHRVCDSERARKLMSFPELQRVFGGGPQIPRWWPLPNKTFNRHSSHHLKHFSTTALLLLLLFN